MAKHPLVLAFFDDEAAADEAANAVRHWDKASTEIKLGSIGVLVKDEKGVIKPHKLGAHKTRTYVILFAVAGALSGGMTALGGAVIGYIVGSFFNKGLGLSKHDLSRIGSALDGGKAAVGVVAAPDEAPAVAAKLAELGGSPETHEVTEEALDQAAAAAAEEATQAA